jgi:hypothetical protein
MSEGIPTVQGYADPSSGIYGNTLHPRPHPNPITPEANPDNNDMRFRMLDLGLHQRLLVDNAIATLDDIGV